jgi:transposase
MIAHQDRQTALLPDVMPTGVYVIFDLYFSDESRFCLDYHDGQRRVWRQKNERFKNCCVAEHDRFGGGSIMVWGGISYDGSTDLYVIRNGSLTGIRYRDEILAPIVRLYAGAIGDDLILMDDNARPHHARIVNEYLQQETIERMDWPAKSPDLNPIEHAWDILQRRISNRQNQPNSLQELADALVDEWSRIPQVEFQTLIRSFQNRCGEVIRARGGHARY